MDYLNVDLEIHPRREDGYPVVARSEAGEARHLMRFPWEEAALDTALLRVENALLRAGHVRRGTGTPEEQVIQHFGQTLFEALLAEEVRRLYDRSAARATQQGQGVRVRLRIQAPELAVLPWEFLYDPLQHDYLCFLPDTVIVRYLEVAQPLPPFQVDPPLRVLALIADPNDQDRLDVTRERQRLSAALRPLEQRGLVKLRWIEGQTVQALQRALVQGRWHIWHYIGHGGFDPRLQEGVLALVNELGSSHLLRATDLGRVLAQHASLRLVVLNSCQGAVGSKQDLFSSTAATLASKRIPAVLAMQYDISDQAALEFTRGFYEALAVGKPVDEALAYARTAISVGVSRTLEWVTPVLYLRAPTGLLFQVPPQVSGILSLPQPEATPREWPGTQPIPPTGGRPPMPSNWAGAAPPTHQPDAMPLPPPVVSPPTRVSAPPDPGGAPGHHTGQSVGNAHWLPGPSSMGVAPGPPTPGALPEPRGGQRRRMVLLVSAILAVLLVVVAGVGVYVVVQSPPVGQITPTPGPTHSPASTVISPTATSTPNATATAVATLLGRYDTITSGPPSFFDPLNNPSTTGWGQGIGGQGTCQIENGGFHMTTTGTGYWWNCFDHSGSKFANFVYRVRLVIFRSGGGMSFRSNGQSYYSFHITQDGMYCVYFGNEELKCDTSTHVRTGVNHVNTIAVLADGMELSFFINDQYVTTVLNDALSNGGIGVTADASSSQPGDVVFNDATVWSF